MTIVERDDSIQIERFETAPFGTNAYLLVCRETGDSVLIDAPGDAAKIAARMRTTNPRYILMTHSHIDHTAALRKLKAELGVPVASHEADAEGLPEEAEILLDEDSTVTFGATGLRVLHTPGHTPGSLCFVAGRSLISGDTLFPGGPGKTGTPDAFKQIVRSITGKLFGLPDDTPVYPGHGDPTVLKREKEGFAVFSARSHPPDLCGDVLWLSS